MITVSLAKERLAEIAKLPHGWEFGDGEAPSLVSLARAKQILEFAAGKVGIQEMEVFPRADSAVDVHLYNDPGTLELTCWPDDSISTLIERPGEPRQRERNISVGRALNVIIEFAIWSSTAFSTLTIGPLKSVDTTVRAFKFGETEFRSYASHAPSVVQISEKKELALDYNSFIPPIQGTSSQSYGNWGQGTSMEEEEWSSFSLTPQVGMCATMT